MSIGTSTRRSITALAALAAVAIPASSAMAAPQAPPSVPAPGVHGPSAKALKPRIRFPRHHAPRISARVHGKATNVAGVDAFATATFECSWNAVVGTAGTLSGLQGSGVWALAWVYDYGTRRWSNAGAWVPADGIHQFVVGASDPYMYAYMVYARYANGWRYSAEYTPINEGGDIRGGAFCP